MAERDWEAFVAHLGTCHCFSHRKGQRGAARAGADAFLEHLRTLGIAPPAEDKAPPVPPLMQGFLAWMHQRGVRERTLEAYVAVLVEFAEALGPDPAAFTAVEIRRFILEQAARGKPGMTRRAISAVRAFMRYLVANGRCAPALIAAVPTIASWRLTSLPKYLSASDVERVVSASDSSTSGLRDHAIVLLLARLGLRAGDVASLRLNDLDWRRSRVRVVGKSRRQAWLPLPQDVGDTILAYLEHARPKSQVAHVFLRVHAPLKQMGAHCVGSVVRSAMRRAGIKAPARGAHVLRHSAATGMLQQGANLDLIGAILRHKSPETTAIYSKVDVAALREVAQPWISVEVSQ